jgi:hypothetical protein
MTLSELESLHNSWQTLSGIAQDAYREAKDATHVDSYSEETWRHVLWYLEQLYRHTAPADVVLRAETDQIKQRVHDILDRKSVRQSRRVPAGS